MATEGGEVELMLGEFTVFVGNIEEDVDFLVYILYILRVGKRDGFGLMEPPHIGTVPQQDSV